MHISDKLKNILILNFEQILTSWVDCESDQLGEYILSLLAVNMPKPELITYCVQKLRKHFGADTDLFVSKLFDFIDDVKKQETHDRASDAPVEKNNKTTDYKDHANKYKRKSYQEEKYKRPHAQHINHSISIENISNTQVNEEDVRAFFEKYGEIKDVAIHPNKKSAIVEYENAEAVKQVLNSKEKFQEDKNIRVCKTQLRAYALKRLNAQDRSTMSFVSPDYANELENRKIKAHLAKSQEIIINEACILQKMINDKTRIEKIDTQTLMDEVEANKKSFIVFYDQIGTSEDIAAHIEQNRKKINALKDKVIEAGILDKTLLEASIKPLAGSKAKLWLDNTLLGQSRFDCRSRVIKAVFPTPIDSLEDQIINDIKNECNPLSVDKASSKELLIIFRNMHSADVGLDKMKKMNLGNEVQLSWK